MKIGIWIKHIGGEVLKSTHSEKHAKLVVDYCVGHGKVEDWGFYDPRKKK